jgi:hypothetical protein
MENNAIRNPWPRRMMIAGGILFFLLLVAAGLNFLLADSMIDIWWFDALGYQFYFWQRMLYRYLVFGSVSLLFFLIFFLNFWVAARFFRREYKGAAPSDKRGYRRVVEGFQTGSLLFYIPLSIVLSIPLSLPLYQNWEHFLFYVFGKGTGVRDPFFVKDIAFYLFSLPIHSLLQRRLFFALVILLVGLFLLYMAKNRLQANRLFHFSGFAKWHLSVAVLAVFGIEIWGLMVQRYALVYDASHEPLFAGPGYVQMNVIAPLLWLLIGLLTATAIILVAVLRLRKGYKVLAGVVIALAVAFAARYSDFLPRLVQNYWVKPNEIAKEKQFIGKNSQNTLAAYNLTHVEARDFNHQRFPLRSDPAQVDKVLRNIPVWEAQTLESVFQQLQELRAYYTFPLVSVGRYHLGDRYQQVFLSPRELDFDNFPGESRNWSNDHLLYTHGYGVVMTPASQDGDNPMTWFLRNIPQESQYGFGIDQPRIYYGMQPYPYAIAPNKAGELDYPSGESNVTNTYDGRGGVPISSLGRKLLFSYYFKDKNIFLSTKITKESKMLFRRNVLERIRQLTPYLLLDQTPYVATTAKGIYWIVDAYTTSSWYPAAATSNVNQQSLNYIRNSVKIVVDAYHGSVDYYVFDPADPIMAAYQRIYPGFFKDKSRMPAELLPHVRYPKDLFDIQMRIYAKYHQADPQVFFQQEDLWTFAQGAGKETTVPLTPYYVTLDLIQTGQLDFSLLVPLFPKGRDNLRAMGVAGCDGDNYGKIIIYDFPKGELVYGPAQIDALINQDPTIAQQFTLWDQAGSSVVRGKMIMLPIQNSVLFIQPVYLKATSRVKIPELQRIIMSEGRVAVMETSLQEAFIKLRQRVEKEAGEIQNRFPQAPDEQPPAPLEPPAASPPGEAVEPRAPQPEPAPEATPAPPEGQEAPPVRPRGVYNQETT